MEPSPAKKPKPDLRQLTQDDSEVIRKLVASVEKHFKLKNQLHREVEMELRQVKKVVKRDPSLQIFVQQSEYTSHWIQ